MKFGCLLEQQVRIHSIREVNSMKNTILNSFESKEINNQSLNSLGDFSKRKFLHVGIFRKSNTP